jgi:hypothetical protein
LYFGQYAWIAAPEKNAASDWEIDVPCWAL